MQDIAVVVPIYNGENMLESCVESIHNAGDRIKEIIIVDDGSTDGTFEKVSSLAKQESKIRVIHTENHGTYMARTTGMKAATATYVTSIDVDDKYCRGCLDRLADLLEMHEADVVMGRIVETDSLDPVEPIKSSVPEIRVSTVEQMWPRIMKWKTQEFVCYINKLYKREILPDFVEADGICQGEDVLITCQAFLEINKIVETTEPMYLYYQNPESLTHVGFGDHDLDLIRVWDKIVEIMRVRRPDLLTMAQFNRWRTDFTMITRLVLVNNKETDHRYAEEMKKWRRSLKKHWKDLLAPHAMPRNRELLVIGFRFFYTPVKALLRLGRKFTKKETSVLLHSGDKR